MSPGKRRRLTRQQVDLLIGTAFFVGLLLAMFAGVMSLLPELHRVH